VDWRALENLTHLDLSLMYSIWSSKLGTETKELSIRRVVEVYRASKGVDEHRIYAINVAAGERIECKRE